MHQKSILITGQFAFLLGFIGFLTNYFFLLNNPVLAFLVGLLFGLSLVMNVTFIARRKVL